MNSAMKLILHIGVLAMRASALFGNSRKVVTTMGVLMGLTLAIELYIVTVFLRSMIGAPHSTFAFMREVNFLSVVNKQNLFGTESDGCIITSVNNILWGCYLCFLALETGAHLHKVDKGIELTINSNFHAIPRQAYSYVYLIESRQKTQVIGQYLGADRYGRGSPLFKLIIWDGDTIALLHSLMTTEIDPLGVKFYVFNLGEYVSSCDL